jgi:hypothetical protein
LQEHVLRAINQGLGFRKFNDLHSKGGASGALSKVGLLARQWARDRTSGANP